MVTRLMPLLIAVAFIAWYARDAHAMKKQTTSYIVPGRSIGILALGDPVTEVNAKMQHTRKSEPKQYKEDFNGCDTTIWVEFSDVNLTAVYCKATRRLISILTTSPVMLVEKTNLHVGSGKDDIEKSHLAQDKRFRTENSWHCYPSFGISFLVENGVIRAVRVFLP